MLRQLHVSLANTQTEPANGRFASLALQDLHVTELPSLKYQQVLLNIKARKTQSTTHVLQANTVHQLPGTILAHAQLVITQLLPARRHAQKFPLEATE